MKINHYVTTDEWWQNLIAKVLKSYCGPHYQTKKDIFSYQVTNSIPIYILIRTPTPPVLLRTLMKSWVAPWPFGFALLSNFHHMHTQYYNISYPFIKCECLSTASIFFLLLTYHTSHLGPHYKSHRISADSKCQQEMSLKMLKVAFISIYKQVLHYPVYVH